ncbi:unnamed protein product [Urochloa humidicola]
MAIPVARVHLAMAHAALPGLLPTPPKCTMLPLLPAPPCAATILIPNNSPPSSPSRADAARRWDAHKTKPTGSPASSSSSASSSASSSRADSEERWDAHKSTASSSASSSASSNKTKTCHIRRRPNGGRASPSSTAERWDAHKKPPRAPAADELDDGDSSTGSNDVELDILPRKSLPLRSLYAGPGFIRSPEPSMLPMPSFMIRVA